MCVYMCVRRYIFVCVRRCIFTILSHPYTHVYTVTHDILYNVLHYTGSSCVTAYTFVYVRDRIVCDASSDDSEVAWVCIFVCA